MIQQNIVFWNNLIVLYYIPYDPGNYLVGFELFLSTKFWYENCD